jgi:hypothetical protein
MPVADISTLQLPSPVCHPHWVFPMPGVRPASKGGGFLPLRFCRGAKSAREEVVGMGMA